MRTAVEATFERRANLPHKSEKDVASQNVIAERDARHDGGRSAGLARKCPAAHDSADNRCQRAGGCDRRIDGAGRRAAATPDNRGHRFACRAERDELASSEATSFVEPLRNCRISRV